MAGALTLSGQQTGIPEGSGSNTISLSITMSTTDVVANFAASGDNTVTVPSTSVGALIIPPAANAVVLKLKGVGGDTGVQISPSNFTLLTWPATPPANFIINAASSVTAPGVVVRFI